MLYLPSPIIELERLPSALLWGYIVTARYEKIPDTQIERYRFEGFVRGKPITEIEVTGLEGKTGASSVVPKSTLFALLENHQISPTILDALEPSLGFRSHHLRGTDTHTVCKLAYHLPVIVPPRLHLVTSFLELPEHDQCPRCRNRMDPSYTPAWRYRIITQPKPRPKKHKLPG